MSKNSTCSVSVSDKDGIEMVSNQLTKNYLRISSRKGHLHGQVGMGSLKMHDNEPVCSPLSMFHWDAISGIDDNDNEYPVYLQVLM